MHANPAAGNAPPDGNQDGDSSTGGKSVKKRPTQRSQIPWLTTASSEKQAGSGKGRSASHHAQRIWSLREGRRRVSGIVSDFRRLFFIVFSIFEDMPDFPTPPLSGAAFDGIAALASNVANGKE
jgi:hypothetical protein